MIWGSGGSKSRLAKAAGAEPAGQMRDEKLHAVVARSRFPSQMYKTHQLRTTFGSWDVKKCTPLWREAHLKSKCTNTPGPDHFWKLRCRKSARRCGAKHISKLKCNKTHQLRTTFGSWDVEKVHAVVARSTLLEVEMSKKCTPLWREAHFQVKMYKTPHVRATFGGSDVEKVHAVVARSHISKSKCTKHHMFAPLLEVRMLKKCTPLWSEAHFQVKMLKKTPGFGPLLEVQMSLRFKTLHYRTLHYTTLQYITLHYITLQYTPLH